MNPNINNNMAIKTQIKPKRAYTPDPTRNGKTTIKPVLIFPDNTPNTKKTSPRMKNIMDKR